MARQTPGQWIPIHMFRKKTRVSYNREDSESVQKAIQKYSKIANSRLKSLRSNNLLQSSSAYKNIVEPKQFDEMEYITGRGYFKTGTKGRTQEQLLEQLDVLERFIKAKSSTITGTKTINETRVAESIAAMQRRGFQEEAEFLRTIYETQGGAAFGEFFRTSAYEALHKLYGSEIAIQILREVASENRDMTNYENLIVQFIRENGYTYKSKPTPPTFIDKVNVYIDEFRFSSVTSKEGEEMANRIRP